MKKILFVALALIVGLASCVKDEKYPGINITGVSYTPTTVTENTNVTVKAVITSFETFTATLYYKDANLVDGKMEAVEMTPTNERNTYAAVIPAMPCDTKVVFYVKAVNDKAEAVSPEMDYTVGAVVIDYTVLRLNELNGNDKFIEIYNAGAEAINMAGCYIEKDGVQNWLGAADVNIEAGGYLLLYSEDVAADHPEFTETVFASVKDLRIGSDGNTVADADMNSFDDFNKYLIKRDETGEKRPFMAFVFYDAPHAFQYGEGCEKFQPAWKEMNYIGLNNSTEKLPVINLYKNSIYYIDKLFGKSLEALKEHNLIDNSIIIVSSDHSQEMNDSSKNFWGHNSAFTDAQTKVPLIIHWPGKQSFKEERRTVHYDIVPTLLEEEFNLTSDKSDFSIGLNLFKDKIEDRKWFIMGSYSKTAIKEENRIIEINGIGLMNFYDNKYDQHPDTTRTPNIYESMKLMSKFLR